MSLLWRHTCGVRSCRSCFAAWQLKKRRKTNSSYKEEEVEANKQVKTQLKSLAVWNMKWADDMCQYLIRMGWLCCKTLSLLQQTKCAHWGSSPTEIKLREPYATFNAPLWCCWCLMVICWCVHFQFSGRLSSLMWKEVQLNFNLCGFVDLNLCLISRLDQFASHFFPSRPFTHFIITFANSWAQPSLINCIFYFSWQWTTFTWNNVLKPRSYFCACIHHFYWLWQLWGCDNIVSLGKCYKRSDDQGGYK